MVNTTWLDGPAYDTWKTTPPENWDTKCKCSKCEEELFEGDDYYELDDEIYCEDCAQEWLSCHKNYVSERMAREGM